MAQPTVPADPPAPPMALTITTKTHNSANIPTMTRLVEEDPSASNTNPLSVEAPYSANIMAPTVTTTTPLAADFSTMNPLSA